MESSIAQDELRARRANAADLWDKLWAAEGDDTWRKEALSRVYTRIERQIKEEGARVLDVGGGIGILAERLRLSRRADVIVADHSGAALDLAMAKGFQVMKIDLESAVAEQLHFLALSPAYIVATEVVEHLSAAARARFFSAARQAERGVLISVPNDRLGPDEEPQHTIKFTAMSLKRELAAHFDDVRIEVLGPFLLAICGPIAKKSFRLSVTLPVRDEERDLEATLASFRGVADQIVVGVDPRTNDRTYEIAEKYADEVFHLESPQGPNGAVVGDKGVHFAHIRNQCMDRCDGDWIFMTEGHERLIAGEETLLELDRVIPEKCRVGLTVRQGNDQQWLFPWLCRNAPDLRYTRHTHNVLDMPDGTFVTKLVGVITLHERHDDRTKERAEQRKLQNRKALMDDWLERQSEHSLFYLASEWREFDPARAIDRFQEFLAVSRNGGMRYQARLILAKELVRADRRNEAREVLMGATTDDWSRTEHWLWLGDLAFEDEAFEQAYRFYRYAATSINAPPYTLWWIDLSHYTYLPAIRLAMTCGQLGRVRESLMWARKVTELLPDNAPAAAFQEAHSNVRLLEEALQNEQAPL